MLIEDHDILSEFIVESSERVERIEGIVLEGQHTRNLPDAETLNRIYRELHTLKGNASFVGLARMVDLCHKSESVLKSVLEDASLWGRDAENFFLEVIDRLRLFLEDPEGTLTQDIGDLIKFELHRTSTEQSSPVKDDVDFDKADLEKASVNDSTMANRREVLQVVENKRQSPFSSETQDTDCYRMCLIKSQRNCADNPDQWVSYRTNALSILLAQSTDTGEFSRSLLDELKGHDKFSCIDRICLATVIPNTNRLRVLDTACSKRIGENSMQVGYSCYVNPRGSLFQLKPGMVRIFNEAKSVVNSFRQEGKPVQRSIAKISAMGLRSGVCIAVGINNVPEGFLFLNSVEERVFNDVDTQFPLLLSQLTTLARIELLRHGYSRNSQMDRDAGEPFLASNFESHLQSESKAVGLEGQSFILVDRSECNFLFEPKRLASILCHILWILRQDQQVQEHEIHYGVCGSRIAFRLKHSGSIRAGERVIPLLEKLSLLHGYEVKISKTFVSVEFTYEPVCVTMKEAYYSVL